MLVMDDFVVQSSWGSEKSTWIICMYFPSDLVLPVSIVCREGDDCTSAGKLTAAGTSLVVPMFLRVSSKAAPNSFAIGSMGSASGNSQLVSSDEPTSTVGKVHCAVSTLALKSSVGTSILVDLVALGNNKMATDFFSLVVGNEQEEARHGKIRLKASHSSSSSSQSRAFSNSAAISALSSNSVPSPYLYFAEKASNRKC